MPWHHAVGASHTCSVQARNTLWHLTRTHPLTLTPRACAQGYRNPDLLTKLVEHDGIQQLGSALPKDVYDAENLPAGNYIGEGDLQQRASGAHRV